MGAEALFLYEKVKIMKKIFVGFILAAMILSAAGCGKEEVQEAQTAPAETSEKAETTEKTEDTEKSENTESSTSTAVEVSDEGLTPIYADELKDGSYEIEVESSSSMFKVVKCIVNVESGKMTADMTMSGQGYGMLYMGTGEDALNDTEDTYIPFVLNEEGQKTFTVPLEALNVETDCAAWSIKKEKWYDRTLIFKADSIPEDSLISE